MPPTKRFYRVTFSPSRRLCCNCNRKESEYALTFMDEYGQKINDVWYCLDCLVLTINNTIKNSTTESILIGSTT